MKESKYNLFVENNNNIIGYNSMTNSYLAMSKNNYSQFLNSRQEISTLKENNEMLFNKLVEFGFLIPDQTSEISEIRLANKETCFNKHYDLTLIPTLDCNLKCWYCWETHVPGSKMSKEVQESVIKHVASEISYNNFDSLNIEWFGGEPLLNFEEVVYPICSSIMELTQKNEKTFTNTFITNGTLLDENIVDKLAGLNSNFQITLDGYQTKHDKVRIKKTNDEGTYKKIIESLYLISEKIKDAKLTIRINFDDQTLKNFEKLVYDLKDLDRSKVKVHLERIWQTKAKPGANKLLQEAILLLTANRFEVDYGGFLHRFVSCKTDRYRQAGIYYTGEVFKCSGRPFTKENKDGYLASDGTIHWDRDRVNRRIGRSTFELEMCQTCQLLPVCMGPCSQKCLEKNWEDMETNCTLKNLDMTIDEYIVFMFNNLYAIQQYKESPKN